MLDSQLSVWGGALAFFCSGQLSLCVSATWSCPLSLYLYASSTQCLVMGVCFCFQQVLDEGSMMVDNLIDDLTIREGHLWLPFHGCLNC